jgi:thiol-disulfide isomerase/thioredoxin
VTVIPALVLVGLLAYGFLAPATDGEDPPGAAPSFEEPFLTGDGTLTDDDLRGEVVVLNFWASWCVPCREEMPVLDRVAEKYSDEGVRVIGVLVRDSAEGGRAFLDEVQVDYPMIYDEDQSLAEALDLAVLPQTYFIDENYRLTTGTSDDAVTGTGGKGFLGEISEEQLEAAIRSLLEES